MSTASDNSTPARGPALLGQTVVVIGGSAGIGLATARLAGAEGAGVVLTGRDMERLRRAAADVGARSHAAFDAHDPARLEAFFNSVPTPVDHVLVTAGNPDYAPLSEMDIADARRYLADHVGLVLEVARHASRKMRPGGALLFMSGTGARRPAIGLGLTALLSAGFVDTPLSAALLGDALDERRDRLRAGLPIRRVVDAADVASLALQLMTNTALTGATFDVDGGQQLT
jgi:NAD(P)-dependent dehydrogenase (short-subunit alcohol dehydrogenase family)